MRFLICNSFIFKGAVKDLFSSITLSIQPFYLNIRFQNTCESTGFQNYSTSSFFKFQIGNVLNGHMVTYPLKIGGHHDSTLHEPTVCLMGTCDGV